MAVYCSKCGHRQNQPMPYCPSCGTQMAGRSDMLPANVGANAAAPFYRERRSRPVGGYIAAAALVVALVVGVVWRFQAAPTCGQAATVVKDHHAVIFAALDLAGMPVSVSCSPIVNPITAARLASAGWTYQGKRYDAAYWVDPSGDASAANLTAGTIDREANAGVNALLALLH